MLCAMPQSNLVRVESEQAPIQVDRHAIAAQELVSDDAPEVEAEQRARRVEVEDDDGNAPELDRAELQIDVGQEEGVLVPARRAVDAERNPPRARRDGQRAGGGLAD